MIRIDDAASLGPALAEIRTMLGLTRTDLARHIADATGRDQRSVAHQVAAWDRDANSPTVRKLAPVLDALGWQLALVPREDS